MDENNHLLTGFKGLKFLRKIDYTTASDPCIFKIKDCSLILSIYVDNGIIINDEAKII